MAKLKFIGIIPARYGSSRFPGKPLAMLCGQTVIERVWRQARKALDTVIVATDDERIAAAVAAFGGKAVMTSPNHKSGTDRCYEAYVTNGGGEDVVINIQGDEPFVRPEQIEALMQCFDDDTTDIATLVKPFAPSRSYAELENPNAPKVVVNKNMNACYFSRSVIPYVRNCDKEEWPRRVQYYTHLGMYAYRAGVLAEVTRLPQSPLELAESLEQLRWLENGYKIKVGVSEYETIGIDTPADLSNAEHIIRNAEQHGNEQSRQD